MPAARQPRLLSDPRWVQRGGVCGVKHLSFRLSPRASPRLRTDSRLPLLFPLRTFCLCTPRGFWRHPLRLLPRVSLTWANGLRRRALCLGGTVEPSHDALLPRRLGSSHSSTRLVPEHLFPSGRPSRPNLVSVAENCSLLHGTSEEEPLCYKKPPCVPLGGVYQLMPRRLAPTQSGSSRESSCSGTTRGPSRLQTSHMQVRREAAPTSAANIPPCSCSWGGLEYHRSAAVEVVQQLCGTSPVTRLPPARRHRGTPSTGCFALVDVFPRKR